MSNKTKNMLETIVAFILTIVLVVGLIGVFSTLFDFEGLKDSIVGSSTQESSSSEDKGTWMAIPYTSIYNDANTSETYEDEYGYTVVQFNAVGSKYYISVPGWYDASKAEIKVDVVEYLIESTVGSGVFDKKITDPEVMKYVGIKIKPKAGQVAFTSEGNPNWDGTDEYVYGFNGEVICIQDKKDYDRFEFNCSSRFVTEGGGQVPIRIRFKGLKVKLTD